MSAKRLTRLCVLVFACVCPWLHSLGNRDGGQPWTAEDIKEYRAEFSGIIRLVGSEPFPQLVVSTGEGRDYIIDDQSPARRELHNMQGRRVRMEAEVRETPVYAGKKKLLPQYRVTPLRYELEPQS